MAASFLDLFGPEGSARPVRRLLGLGLLAAVPTYLTGLLEWAEEERVERRRGGGSGRVLGVAAGLIAFADGYVGGHMSHVRGVATGEIGTGN